MSALDLIIAFASNAVLLLWDPQRSALWNSETQVGEIGRTQRKRRGAEEREVKAGGGRRGRRGGLGGLQP